MQKKTEKGGQKGEEKIQKSKAFCYLFFSLRALPQKKNELL